MRYIYLKLEKQPESINELLKELFKNKNGSMVTNVNTYSNKKCTTLQCKKGKFRSFDNVLTLVNRYFPNTTPEQLIKEMLCVKITDSNENICYLRCGYCSTMRKIRLWYSSKTQYADGFYNLRYTNWKGLSKYSWKDLYEMIGSPTLIELNEIENNKV